ncbi:MAG: hypothetical protein JWR09_2889, partial [Mucilaginibacter sp.]|nr:hypothetical protein [Mucilaginibacter sp.]
KAIEKMTMGDPEQTAKVLARFAIDSTNDVKELKAGLAAENIEKVLLLTHRIAGRTAQAGARELAESFRLAEMELNRDKKFTANRVEHILALAQKLYNLAIATRDYSFIETV